MNNGCSFRKCVSKRKCLSATRRHLVGVCVCVCVRKATCIALQRLPELDQRRTGQHVHTATELLTVS